MTDKPAFEIHVGEHQYKVYADGRTEGFYTEAVKAKIIIINRIPKIVREAQGSVMP